MDAFGLYCSSPAFNEATSGVDLLRALLCAVPHSWVSINQLVLWTSSRNHPEPDLEKAVFISPQFLIPKAVK